MEIRIQVYNREQEKMIDSIVELADTHFTEIIAVKHDDVHAHVFGVAKLGYQVMTVKKEDMNTGFCIEAGPKNKIEKLFNNL